MQTSHFRRFTTAAIVLVAGLGAAASVQARSDVSFSIGIQVPGIYEQPAPVYYPPQPVYIQPRPVYVQPQPYYVEPAPIYYQPRPVLIQPPVYGTYYGPGRGWDRDRWNRRHWRNHYDRDREFDGNHGRN
ncbi:MAG: hypothetical protein ABIR55_07725 [Burkholderiaceae bacterium]